jgi:hypothetical protein
MENLKHHLRRGFWFTVALIFLLESWLWDNVKEWLRALGRALGVERIEPWLEGVVKTLSPQMTLAVFAMPAIAILPFKIAALSLIGHGHVMIGVIAIFLAKTLALGVTSFLFDACRDKLLEMQWFVRFYSLVLDARAWATDLIAPYKAHVLKVAALIKTHAASIMAKDGGEFARRWARLRDLARAKRAA